MNEINVGVKVKKKVTIYTILSFFRSFFLSAYVSVSPCSVGRKKKITKIVDNERPTKRHQIFVLIIADKRKDPRKKYQTFSLLFFLRLLQELFRFSLLQYVVLEIRMKKSPFLFQSASR